MVSVTFVLDIIMHFHSVFVIAYVADDLELVVGWDRMGSIERGRTFPPISPQVLINL